MGCFRDVVLSRIGNGDQGGFLGGFGGWGLPEAYVLWGRFVSSVPKLGFGGLELGRLISYGSYRCSTTTRSGRIAHNPLWHRFYLVILERVECYTDHNPQS